MAGAKLVSWNQSSQNKTVGLSTVMLRESGHPEVFEIPGFRLALAIASLAGMTRELLSGFLLHDT